MKHLLLGLTGGIGGGKSTALSVLQEMGAWGVDADKIAYEVTAKDGVATPAIVQKWGAQILLTDGSLDRARLRALVFSDTLARQALEAIVHPLVHAAMWASAQEAIKNGSSMIVFDVPLLVECGKWRHQLDKILVVDCGKEERKKRVARRSQLSRAEIERIIEAQVTPEVRLSAADIVVDNTYLNQAQFESTIRAVGQYLGL